MKNLVIFSLIVLTLASCGSKSSTDASANASDCATSSATANACADSTVVDSTKVK